LKKGRSEIVSALFHFDAEDFSLIHLHCPVEPAASTGSAKTGHPNVISLPLAMA
jgi:hypothetical protein